MKYITKIPTQLTKIPQLSFENLNTMILECYADVLNYGKVTQLTEANINALKDIKTKTFCKLVKEVLNKASEQKRVNKKNLRDMMKFWISDVGEPLRKHMLKDFNILDWPNLTKILVKPDFDFVNSPLMTELIEYSAQLEKLNSRCPCPTDTTDNINEA